MSNIQLTVESINKLQPLDIVTDPSVRSRFIQIYNTLWGEGTGEAAYERESNYFNRLLSDNEKLRTSSTRFSIFTAFIDLAVCGLSLEPGTRALCYLQGRSYKIGEQLNDKGQKVGIYEGRCTLTISGYGELVMRIRSGHIRHADNPVLVYEEDEFSFSDRDGRKSVDYICHLPHKSNNIIACYMHITRADGTDDYSIMSEQDWMRLKIYSAKNNRRWNNDTRSYDEIPNDLYTANNGTIDTSFLMAKCIKHAFKTYPKVRIGKNTELETQQPEKPEIDDYYGMDYDPQPFGNTSDTSAGITVNPSETSSTDDDGAF